MNNNDAATEPRWWNGDTTLAEIATWYAGWHELTPENHSRFVANLRADGFSDRSLKQCAEDKIERIKNKEDIYATHSGSVPDLDTAMESIYDDLVNGYLLGGPGDEYFTDAQIATRVLDVLYSHPHEMNATYHVLSGLTRELTVLGKRSKDSDILQAALDGAKCLASDELRRALENLAENPGYSRNLLHRLRF